MAKTVMELVMEARAEIENLPVADAADEMGTGAVILLDIREPLEWEHHIAGAHQIPRYGARIRR